VLPFPSSSAILRLNAGACPECAGVVVADRSPIVTELLVCQECGAELEVTAVEPLELALAPEVEEDWGE
jgi:alpha-aminoadipate/glutamate carrier protein LysW